MYVCMYVRKHARTHACMHACMYVCIYYVYYMYIYIYIYYIYIFKIYVIYISSEIRIDGNMQVYKPDCTCTEVISYRCIGIPFCPTQYPILPVHTDKMG